MAVEKWLLRELARASARYDKLPEHARPIVTRPVMSGREAPSNAPRRDDATSDATARQ